MQIVVETYWRETGETSARQVRVRPLRGQPHDDMRVWCSVASRADWEVGSFFLIRAMIVLQSGKDTYRRAYDPPRLWRRLRPEDPILQDALSRAGRNR